MQEVAISDSVCSACVRRHAHTGSAARGKSVRSDERMACDLVGAYRFRYRILSGGVRCSQRKGGKFAL